MPLVRCVPSCLVSHLLVLAVLMFMILAAITSLSTARLGSQGESRPEKVLVSLHPQALHLETEVPISMCPACMLLGVGGRMV